MGITVWSLSSVSEGYQSHIDKANLTVHAVPMFEPQLNDSLGKAKEFLQLMQSYKPDAVVLTSKNAAEVLNSWLSAGVVLRDELPALAAVGVKTMMKLSDDLSEEVLYPDVFNAVSLANELIEHDYERILHLCGDKSRKELKNTLTASGAAYQSLVVYTTSAVPFDKSIIRKTPPDVIWALSPSSVERFYKKTNGYFNSVKYLTIGLTTYDTARNIGLKNVFVASESSIESMIEDTTQIV